MFDYQNVVEKLRNNVCTVTFEKVDGSKRVMECTLNPQYLPERDASVTGSVISEGDGEHEVVHVWDVHANGWRAFRLSSLQSITVE